MTNQTQQKSIIAIDLLRALAALGVFFYHNHLGYVLVKTTGLSFFTAIDMFGALYAVPLFFLISGYCIHASNIKYLKTSSRLPLKQYYKRRFLRIYPPYLFALVLTIAIYYCTTPTYQFNVYDFVTHLFLLQGFSTSYFNTINVVLWTITVEMAFYIIYPIFYKLRLKYGPESALLVTLPISASSIAFIQTKGAVSLPEHFFVLNLWFSWCCGAYLADKKMLKACALNKPIYAIFYLLILAGFIYLKNVPNNQLILSDQFSILLWTAPLMLALSAEPWLQKHHKNRAIQLLVAVGLSSYSLYLLHEPLIYLKNLAVQAYLPAPLQKAGVAMGMLAIPVITWFSYKFFEKPFMHLNRTVHNDR